MVWHQCAWWHNSQNILLIQETSFKQHYIAVYSAYGEKREKTVWSLIIQNIGAELMLTKNPVEDLRYCMSPLHPASTTAWIL